MNAPQVLSENEMQNVAGANFLSDIWNYICSNTKKPTEKEKFFIPLFQ